MLFMFTPKQAREMGAIADAASKDVYRPLITYVQFNYEQVKDGAAEITVVGTDSYVLAQRIIHLDSLTHVWEDEEKGTTPKGQLLLEGKDFKATMKEAAKTAKLGEVVVEIDPLRKALTVSVEAITASSYRRELQNMGSQGTFPNWKQLMPDRWLKDGDLELPALDPKKLVQMASCVSTTPSERGDFPFRFRASADAGNVGNMKPWGFLIPEVTDSHSEFVGLVMPVRLP